MSTGTLVLLAGSRMRELDLLGLPTVVVEAADGPDATLAARTCAAINVIDPPAPLVIASVGERALLLPAVALSQRSNHRSVSQYLLIEPELPPVTDGWPDAPVTIVTDDADSEAARQGRLRGWRVLSLAQLDERVVED